GAELGVAVTMVGPPGDLVACPEVDDARAVHDDRVGAVAAGRLEPIVDEVVAQLAAERQHPVERGVGEGQDVGVVEVVHPSSPSPSSPSPSPSSASSPRPSAAGPPSSSRTNCSSSRMVRPSSSALAALEPALAPTTT